MSYLHRTHSGHGHHANHHGSSNGGHGGQGGFMGRPLPRGTTIYARGKRLEAEGDLRGAYECFVEALMHSDRSDSALKDISNIYVMYGRIQEAISFLKLNAAFVTNRRGYENLILRLQQELDLEHATAVATTPTVPTTTNATTGTTTGTVAEMPRTLLLTHGVVVGGLDTEYLAQVFPNAPKIRRVLMMDDQRALVQFATYSSARKALNVVTAASGLVGSLVGSLVGEAGVLDGAVGVEWAAKEDEELMSGLEKKKESGRQERLPYKLQVFNDERSLVSFYSITDTVVLQVVENLLFCTL